ncbi:MAG: glutamine--fructose-6-phosphate aminotransferase, partial [Nitrospirae bacterium]|nr:glutamine--fructose-6-phosphate aminotransferase [Nitrospirota bacterium]
MCGIVGYVGKQEAVPILLNGLKRLEYRGYDSAGIAVLQGGKIEVRRSVGKLANLEKALAGQKLSGTIGVGHTRWATHGKPSEQNAHPHRSDGCVLVHNGIIENYLPLKRQLQKEGVHFESETDTEVVAHLIGRYLRQGRTLVEAVRVATRDICGSYAIVAVCESEPDRLVAARSGCPLVIGRTEGASLVASDVMAMLTHTRDVTYLEEGDVAVV